MPQLELLVGRGSMTGRERATPCSAAISLCELRSPLGTRIDKQVCSLSGADDKTAHSWVRDFAQCGTGMRVVA
jgi:hypothetical protein